MVEMKLKNKIELYWNEKKNDELLKNVLFVIETDIEIDNGTTKNGLSKIQSRSES